MNRETVLLRSALNCLSEAVAVSDKDGQLLFFNKANHRYFDSRLMARRPRQWSKSFGLYLPDQKTPFPLNDLPLIQAIRGKETNAVEMYVRNAKRPQGDWLSVGGRPVRDSKGRIIGGVAVIRNITDRKKSEQDIVEISGREQRRIGQDLHDGLCQTLLAGQFALRILTEKMHHHDMKQAAECVAEIRSHLNHALAQADVIARGLYPVELEARGLQAALIEMVRNYSRIYRVAVSCSVLRSLQISDPVLSTHLYRIAQEAVANAIKSGRATRIQVNLRRNARALRLVVTDNGCGISKEAQRNGMGLQLMAYRARIISARLTFERVKTGGTRVCCVVGGSRS